MRREVLEEVELSGIRPVDVLEDEHRGLLERDLFDEPARREEQLDGLLGGLVARTPVRSVVARSRVVSVGLVRSASGRGPGASSFALGIRRRIGLEDPRHLTDLLREGAVAGLAVREAATADGTRTRRFDPRHDLGGHPGLADPGGPDDRDEMGPELGGGPLPDGVEQGSALGIARRAAPWSPGRSAGAPRSAASASHASTGSRLPFAVDGFELSIADHVPAWRDTSPRRPRAPRAAPTSGAARRCSRRRPTRGPRPLPDATPGRRSRRPCSPPPGPGAVGRGAPGSGRSIACTTRRPRGPLVGVVLMTTVLRTPP